MPYVILTVNHEAVAATLDNVHALRGVSLPSIFGCDNIYPRYRETALVKLYVTGRTKKLNIGNSPVHQNVSSGKCHLSVSDSVQKTPCVSASGGTEHRTQPIVPTYNNPFALFGNVTLVPDGATVTVVSYAVPLGVTLRIEGFQYSGNSMGIFTLLANGNTVIQSHSSAATLTGQVDLMAGKQVLYAGDTVAVTIHCTDGVGNFNATLLGEYDTA